MAHTNFIYILILPSKLKQLIRSNLNVLIFIILKLPYAEIPGHMIVLLELIQNNRFVWGNRCYVIIGLMAQILSY